jgi:nitrite reductase/ring-hydroxylating ferredoxin subunit
MGETPIYEVPLEAVRGRCRGERVGGREILIVDTPEGLRVYDGVCPHLGGPLVEGRLTPRAVVCPWHAYTFDPVSGRCLTIPGGAWRLGGLSKGEGRPMSIHLQPLRHELEGGVLRIYAS